MRTCSSFLSLGRRILGGGDGDGIAQEAAEAGAAAAHGDRRRARWCGTGATSLPIATCASMRASELPAQVWMPKPKARWRFGSRRMSSRSGSGNCAGIAVGRADAEMHIGAGRHGDVADAGVGDGAAVAELVRAFHAQEFLDRGVDRLRMGGELAHRVGMAEQQIDAVADQVGGGLVAGVEQEDAVVQQLQLRVSRSPPSPAGARDRSRRSRWTGFRLVVCSPSRCRRATRSRR